MNIYECRYLVAVSQILWHFCPLSGSSILRRGHSAEISSVFARLSCTDLSHHQRNFDLLKIHKMLVFFKQSVHFFKANNTYIYYLGETGFFLFFFSNWRFRQNTATGCCSARVLRGTRRPVRSAGDRPSSPSAPTRTKTSQTACLCKTTARPTTSAGTAAEGLTRAWEGARSFLDVPFETKKK